MRFCIQILFVFLLAGCFEEEIPAPKKDVPVKSAEDKPEDKPNSDHEEESIIDPFDLKALLKKPIEDLPAGIPDYSSLIDPKSLAENFVSLESLEGTWYGALFSIFKSTPVKDRRVYLQFRSDKSFSYGCVDMSTMTYVRASLITGKYSIEDGNLQLQTQFYKDHMRNDTQEITAREETISSSRLYMFLLLCGNNSWQSSLELTIPIRSLDLSTMVLFDENFSNASVFLVRK